MPPLGTNVLTFKKILLSFVQGNSYFCILSDFRYELKIFDMKHILPILFFVISFGSLSAQNLIVSNADTIELSADMGNLDVVAHTTVTNNTRSTMNLVWVLTNLSRPAGWETAICDKNNCYPPFVLTNVVDGGNPNAPVVLDPNEESIIDLHLYPDGIAGVGYAQVCFHTVEEPDVILGCMDYKYSVGASSSTDDEVGPIISQVFPNPTTEYFGLTNANGIQEVKVYNMLGRQQRSYEVALGKKYYVGDMPAGMYLVAFIDTKGHVAKTTRLVKRLYRP